MSHISDMVPIIICHVYIPWYTQRCVDVGFFIFIYFSHTEIPEAYISFICQTVKTVCRQTMTVLKLKYLIKIVNNGDGGDAFQVN